MSISTFSPIEPGRTSDGALRGALLGDGCQPDGTVVEGELPPLYSHCVVVGVVRVVIVVAAVVSEVVGIVVVVETAPPVTAPPAA